MKGLRRVALLANPTSGKGRSGAAAAQVQERLQAAGVEVRVLLGVDGADALRRARAAVADGVEALVAVGGDGTAHLALQAVAGTHVPLGLVPAGTGNDLAAGLGLPTEVGAATDRVLDGDVVPVDAVRAGERWWACVLGTGFDAAVNDRANRMGWPRGRRRYDLAVAAELRTFRPVPLVVETDGARREVEAMLVAVGNAASYGGGMRICPDARMDDGLLDVVVVGPLSRRAFVAVFPKVFKGAHLSHPAVTVLRAGTVALSSPDASGGPSVYADGEAFGGLPVRSTVVPGALRLLGADLPAT